MAAGGGINWDANDPFGSPPRGPRGAGGQIVPPVFHVHVDPDPGADGPDEVDPHYHVQDSEFQIRTRYNGDWPNTCTFSVVVDEHGRRVRTTTTKNGSREVIAEIQNPCEFIISHELRHVRHADRPVYKNENYYAIKAVLQRKQSKTPSPFEAHFEIKGEKYIQELWSAPISATNQGEMTQFAQWAKSRGFDTVFDVDV